MSKNNFCYERCRTMFIHVKMTGKSKFLLRHLKFMQLVKISFLVFRQACLIFMGQTSHLDMVYPEYMVALALEPFIC